MVDETEGERSGPWQGIALFGGPLLGLAVLALDLDPAKPEVSRAAAVAVWMAVWWIFEAIPLAATALLPMAAFPLLGVMNGKAVASQYFNWVIFLFLGGFLVALAMERWGLHRRIALRLLLLAGTRPRGVLLGFMGATWFLSMWISNTATAMMMVAIAIPVAKAFEDELPAAHARSLSSAIFLGVAYAASIGGIATLVGTPPNVSYARQLTVLFPEAPEVSFGAWFAFASPLSLTLLLIAWLWLGRGCPSAEEARVDRGVLERSYAELGPWSFAERVVLVDFLLLIGGWLTRGVWSSWLPRPEFVNDGVVGIVLALPLFAIPAVGEAEGERILDWETAKRLPWGVVLLFGGGFALAAGFVKSGLSAWLGEQLAGLAGLPSGMVVAATTGGLTFLTELTSNTASTEMALPVLAELGVALKVDPRLVMVAGTLACSCAFMLPVATPPNAIVFGSGKVSMREMVRSGLFLNLVAIVLITIAVFALGRPLLGLSLELPAWALRGR